MISVFSFVCLCAFLFVLIIFIDGLAVEAPLWRMFFPEFEGKVNIVRCGAGEEGWNRTIISNFRMPDEAALNAVLPGGKGASAGAGGSTAGTKPVDDKKGKEVDSVAGGEEASKFRKIWATAVPRPKHVVSTESVEEPVPVFATPPSSPKVVYVETQKKGGEDHSIEVVSSGGTPSSVHAEQASKKTAGETIFDTLDSSNNLIDLQDDSGQGGAKTKSPVFEKKNIWFCCRGHGG
ncbi:hypothetical protein HanPI659440_Chr01g0005621 [Helianthus annuus]|nr:hypothetical protein HanPI659440_Chr01g0005621 [Helianthus annuus]